MTGPDTDLAPAHSQEALSVGNCWDCGSKSLASRPRGSPAWPHVPRPSHTRHPQPVPDGASTVWKPSPALHFTPKPQTSSEQSCGQPCPPLLASSLSSPDPRPILPVRWAWRPAAGEAPPPASVLGRPGLTGCARRWVPKKGLLRLPNSGQPGSRPSCGTRTKNPFRSPGHAVPSLELTVWGRSGLSPLDKMAKS